MGIRADSGVRHSSRASHDGNGVTPTPVCRAWLPPKPCAQASDVWFAQHGLGPCSNLKLETVTLDTSPTKLRPMPARRFFLYLTVLLGVVLPGAALRLMSVHWNQRLQGDVNLYALTAREFQRVSRLEYPFKYDYYGASRYESMRAQATQHPPLFPFLGGLVSKLTGNSDTFASLRNICLITGLMLLGLVVELARATPLPVSAPVALTLAAFLPMLVDFSGNGSPYIILAAIFAGLSILLLRFDPDRPRHYVLIGILLALGYMVHAAITLAVPGVILFFASIAKRLRFSYLLMLCTAGFLTLAPMMVWNMSYQGVPIYSTAPLQFRVAYGAAEVGIRDGIIKTYPTSRSLLSLLKRYPRMEWHAVQAQLGVVAFALGPGMLLLASMGLKRLLDQGTITLLAMLGPSASYLAFSLLIPFSTPRYVLPVFPVMCVIASVGYKALTAVGRRGMILASLFLLLTAVWWIADFRFSPNQTRYYVEDTAYTADYDAMKQLALRMRTIRPGVVLSYSRRLDSGLETAYYHDLPLVSGRRGLELFDQPEVEKLVHDFHVSYIWTDESLLEKVQEWFPRARVVLTGPPFSLLELTPNEEPVGDLPKGSTASTRVLSP